MDNNSSRRRAAVVNERKTSAVEVISAGWLVSLARYGAIGSLPHEELWEGSSLAPVGEPAILGEDVQRVIE